MATNALSRRDSDIHCTTMSIPQWIEWTALRQAIREDIMHGQVVQALEWGESIVKPFFLVNGILYCEDKLVVQMGSNWVPRLLAEFHSTPSGVMWVHITHIDSWLQMFIRQV